jgi:hypothetical protein
MASNTERHPGSTTSFTTRSAYDALGERPILLLRVNADAMFVRQHVPGVGMAYQGSSRFHEMMETVAEKVKGNLVMVQCWLAGQPA